MNSLRNTGSFFAVFIAILALCFVAASADAEISSGTWNNLTWTLADDGTLTISGTGELGPFSFSAKEAWRQYTEDIKTVVLQEGVTCIGSYAFDSCSNLTNITIPKSVTTIGYLVFGNCTSLTAITIPESVTTIGRLAFYGCTSLTAITIPESVTTIESSAFAGCTSLTAITIPDSVTKIESGAFHGCTALDPNQVKVSPLMEHVLWNWTTAYTAPAH